MKFDASLYHRREILSIGTCCLGTGSLYNNVLGSIQDNTPNPGTILMCGGGKLPESILERFCELSDHANSTLVLIPTASPRSDTKDYSPWLEIWRKKGWRKIDVLHAADQPSALNADFAKQIQDASAVWIGGGDQTRLADRFLSSTLLMGLHKLLLRGGTLGGTSAGAAILSKQMIADGIDTPIMGQGFGILPKLIIDQHFSQKKRFKRLAKAVEMQPKLIGIGIDESTGIELTGSNANVIGQGQVHAYQYDQAPLAWSAGDSIDPSAWPALFEYGLQSSAIQGS